MDYIKRHAEKTLDTVSKMYPAVIVTGQRQVGKTTLLKQCRRGIGFLSFDDPQTTLYATESPGLFFKTNPPPVILDEVQYVPEILRYVKILADEKQQSGMFYMTGSQAFHLMKGASESLAGRVGIIELLGLSLREINDCDFYEPFLPTERYIESAKGKSKEVPNDELWKLIHKGSMPKLYTREFSQAEWSQYYSDYLRTYIEKDVRALINVGNERAFMQFMRLLAAATAQTVNFTNLATEVGKDVKTIKSWVSVLQNCGILYLLPPYHSNINKRIVKTPKAYLLDTGLCSYLSGWYETEQLQFGAMSGAMLETFVIGEIIKSYRNNGIDTNMRLSFYRDKEQREIDLIIEENGTLYPVEIKKTATPSPKDVSKFKIIANEPNKKLGDGALIYSGDKEMFLRDNVRAIPMWYL